MTINRKMWQGIDQESGELETVLEVTQDGDIALFPFGGDMVSLTLTQERFNELLVYGGTCGNALNSVPKYFYPDKLDGYTLLWEDNIELHDHAAH